MRFISSALQAEAGLDISTQDRVTWKEQGIDQPKKSSARCADPRKSLTVTIGSMKLHITIKGPDGHAHTIAKTPLWSSMPASTSQANLVADARE